MHKLGGIELPRDRGPRIYSLLKELFPICRSLTGRGVDQTLEILSRFIPIKLHQFPTGMKCFDWEIPEEWNIHSALIENEQRKVIVDFADNNLHVVSYSEPVNCWVSLDELKPHIFTYQDRPNSIPYVTSYYQRQWGFCMAHNDFMRLTEGKYHVIIDSSFSPGHLKVAEVFLPGEIEKEILLSCYYCHPSMANDSISGVALTTCLYEELAAKKPYYGYRFLFVPETIGAIAYLSQHKEIKEHLHAGFVVTCVGDPGPFNYKQTRQGNHVVDKVTENVLKHSGYQYLIRPFWPSGSDERQYCSPGFNLPVGSLMRSVYGEFAEYHTSDDNLTFVTEKALGESCQIYLLVLKALQDGGLYRNTNPDCEPQMSRRGLYSSWGTPHQAKSKKSSQMMWILNFSDGEHFLVDIAEKMGVSIFELIDSIHELQEVGLLERIG